MIFNDNVVENAASALAQLLQNKLDTVGYDKTMVYTIVDDSQKEKGCYKVTDGSITFEAYSDVTNYKKDEKIYITIPQGDFREKKVILGKYIETEESLKDVGYVSPEDRIVPIYEQKIETNGTLFLYSDEENSDLVWGSHIQLTPDNDWKFIENTLSRLVVNCEIQSSLSNYNVVSGEYGLKLILLSSQEGTTNFKWDSTQKVEPNIELAKSQGLIVNYLEFSSKDMIGNIYNYKGSIHQSKIFNISNVGNIFYCIPLFYYKKNFKSLTLTGEKDLEECLRDHPSELIIEFQNLSLTFGFDQTEFDQEDNLIIFNDPRINVQFNSKESINKSLYGYNIVLNSKNGKFENYTNFSQNEYLYWYEDSFINNDNRGGKGWQQIESQFNKKLSLINFTISSKEVKKSYKAVKVIIDDETKSETNISSNIIEYANADYGENASGLVWLEILDEQKDYKNLYGENYAIINFEDFQKVRTIKASIPETRTYNKIRIEWLIPRGSSMILDVYDNLEGRLINSKYLALSPSSSSTYDYTDDYYSIVKEYEGAEVLDLSFFKLSFGIKQFYQPTFNRNQIICKVYYNDDRSYYDEGKINLSFGRLNNNGTAYDFGVFFENPNKPYLIGNKTDSVSIYCTLSSSKISLSDEEIDICLQQTCKFSSLNGKLAPIQDELDGSKATVAYYGNGQSDIIVASITVRGVTIQAYLPIPLAYEDENNYTNGIQSNSYAYYDSYGSLIKTEQFPLKVYGQLDNQTSQDITIITATPQPNSLSFEPNVGVNGCISIPISTQYDSDVHKNKGALQLDIGKKNEKELYQVFKYKFSGTGKLVLGTEYYLKTITKTGIFNTDKTHIQRVLIGINNELYYLKTIKGSQDSDGAIKHEVYSDEDCENKIDGEIEVNWSSDRIASKHFLVSPDSKASTIYSFVYLVGDGIYSIDSTPHELSYRGGIYNSQKKYGTWYIYTLTPASTTYPLIKNIKKWSRIDTDVFLNPQSLNGPSIYSGLSSIGQDQVGQIKNSTYNNYYLQIYSAAGTFLGNAKFAKDNALEFDTVVSETTGYVAMHEFQFDSKTIPSGASLSVDWRITSTANKDQETPIGKPIIVTDQKEGSEEKSSFIQYYPIYISNNNVQYYLEAYIAGENGGVATICWQQPLLIQQNNYEFEILNNWNGQTEITDASIMSPCIGAGSKNEYNQFSGVLMGKISKSEADKTPIHGLYGFSDGAQAFGFKEDGTAFIGKSGAGRIDFDGRNGTITSLGYENSFEYENTNGETVTLEHTGLKIDLDDPSLDMKYEGKSLIEFAPKREKMVLNSSNTYDLKDAEGKIISSSPKFSLNLNEGTLKAIDFSLFAGDESYIQSGSGRGLSINSKVNGKPPLFVGYDKPSNGLPFTYPSFQVGWNGDIEAKDLNLNGLKVNNSTLSFDSKLDWYNSESFFGSLEMGRITFTGGDYKGESYILYFNMEGTSSSTTFFIDIRPNFEKTSGLNYYNYCINQINNTGGKTNIYSKDGITYVIPRMQWKDKTGSVKTWSETSDGKLGDGVLAFTDFTKPNCVVESQNVSSIYFRFLIVDSGDNRLGFATNRLSASWAIIGEGTTDTKLSTLWASQLIAGFANMSEYNCSFSMSGVTDLTDNFIDIQVNMTSGGTILSGPDKVESEGFSVDAFGHTKISTLKVGQKVNGKLTYVSLADYIRWVISQS